MFASFGRRSTLKRTAVLEAEVLALRTELTAMRASRGHDPASGPVAPRPTEPEAGGRAQVSRRRLLRGVGLATGSGVAAALTGGSVLAPMAGAAPGDPVRIDQSNPATGTTTLAGGPDPTLVVSSGGGSTFPAPTAALQGSNADGAGVTGVSDFGPGVVGTTRQGVGVLGIANYVAGAGVHGDVTEPLTPATAVRATTAGMGYAVDAVATNPDSFGGAVHAASAGHVGAVFAEITEPSSEGVTVLAQTIGTGSVIEANLINPTSLSAAIVARTNGRGSAIRGDIKAGGVGSAMQASSAGTAAALRVEQTNASTNVPAARVRAEGTGPGIDASSAKGVGATFAGARAAVRLVPRTVTGSPSSGAHSQGELVIDSAGDLFVCTAGGSPGTWRKVRFV